MKVVKKLPKEVESLPRARKHFSSWASVGYYEEMRHLWKEYKVIHVAKSDSRLANNDLPIDVQRLRCRVLYRGLRFSPAIESLGQVCYCSCTYYYRFVVKRWFICIQTSLCSL